MMSTSRTLRLRERSQVAERAVACGVAVNVLTLAGEDCRMENLGTTADLTGGQVCCDSTRLSGRAP